jgi:recombination protein RecT
LENGSSSPVVPRPAATVVLVRAGENGGVLVYMTRRSARARFMPGAYVFPGGAVDAQDRSAAMLARLRGSVAGAGDELAVAALRELFEEAGVLIATDGEGRAVSLAPERLATLRDEYSNGTPFAALMEREGLFLDARELAYYSNWITPIAEPLRFDTHFFIATAPAGQIASADAAEVHDGVWIGPAIALARAEAGEMTVPFPTRKHLERLAPFDDIPALLAHARARRVTAITPVIRQDGERELITGAEVW